MVNTQVQIFQLEQLLIYYLNQYNFHENQISSNATPLIDICENFESDSLNMHSIARFEGEKETKTVVCNEINMPRTHFDEYNQSSNYDESNNAELSCIMKKLKKSIHKNIMLRLKIKIQLKRQKSKELIAQKDFTRKMI